MKITSGILTLVPTPLWGELPLEPCALKILSDAVAEPHRESTVIVGEEVKELRRRWIQWGLPRECIEHFQFLSEHNWRDQSRHLLQLLKNEKKNVFLLSDGGLPAFCDPGQYLVDLCHKNQIRVTSTPFPHAPALAVALSGYRHDYYIFRGFLARDRDERQKQLKDILSSSQMSIVMDTPYRLTSLLKEMSEVSRAACLAMDLNGPDEWIVRGDLKDLYKQISGSKREFILVLAPKA